MRVTLCVDALEPNPGGIGRYTWQLCRGLARRPEVELRYFARRRVIKDPAMLLNGEDLPRRRFRKWSAWRDQLTLQSGLFHGTNYFLPQSVEGVITVHDLSVFRYPETHPIERVRAFEKEFMRSLDRARHIVTDTETVRAELIADLGVSPNMVTAVHLGVEDRFRKQGSEVIQAALEQFGLQPKQYGLCISTVEPRKKIAELLAAWRSLPNELRSRYPLVLAGGAGWRNDHLRSEIDKGIGEGWLRYLGFVDDRILPALYAGSRLFVYPSIYEGFGLPPLEAMACGVPVIVSNSSCLPEVCGQAGAYVDPDDCGQMLSSIITALSDDAWNAEASRRSLSQASKYSWDRCVDETMAVYRKVATFSR